MPMTRQQATDVVKEVRQRLADAERKRVFLKVTGERLDDDSLYVVVVPLRPGVRASEYANYISEVERELRAAGKANVLLVPALND
ncbi:MAG TPA: hypothetical protein VLJ39_20700 [Tepidisphaeraceae bacterium]|nr:hypothetical protein [Tepidisphaeraceae bacterium]